MHNKTDTLIKQYKVIDCEFNRTHYNSLIGELFFSPPRHALFFHPPGPAKTRMVWADPFCWTEIKPQKTEA